MEATGKYDFSASAEDELSFRKGDVIKILGTNDDWFRAEIHGMEGFVPRNYINIQFPSWYQENTSRQSAQDQLMPQPIGSFLIRGSQSSPGEFSISVRHESDVQHFKVMRDKRGQYYLWSDTFSSLNTLVEFYTHTSISKQGRVFLLTEQRSPSDFPHRRSAEAPPISQERQNYRTPAPLFPRPAERSPPAQASGLGCVRALYDFTAEDADELNFHAGDVIEVLDKSDHSWWKGLLHGRIGLFPVNYTNPL